MQPLHNRYMINKIFKGVLVVALLAGVSACCKKRTYCNGEKLNIIFTGFDHEAVRTVVLKRYLIGDEARTKALDSSVLINTALVVPGKPDTSRLKDYKTNTGKLDGVYFGNDWIMTIPGIDRTYHIHGILEGDNRFTKVKCSDNETKCANTIKTFVVGGLWVESNTMYVQK